METPPSIAEEPSSSSRLSRAAEVVQWLLANNYLLTALELLLEAQEAGRGEEVVTLQAFFADTTKFPPEEVATFQASDAANFKALAQAREEKLFTVEYELRIAREDVAELQARLARQPVGGSSAIKSESTRWSRSGVITAGGEGEGGDGEDAAHASLTLSERQQLNSAVAGYLTASGYRHAALTFLGEAPGASGQAAKGQHRPSLAGILKACSERAAFEEAAKAAALHSRKTEEQLAEAQQQCRSLQEEVARLGEEAERLQESIGQEQKKAVWAAQEVEAAELRLKRDRPSPISLLNGSPSEAPAGALPSSSVQLLVDTLPRLVPNLLIEKRSEVVPVLVTLLKEHPHAPARHQLAHTLFNLVKRPSPRQRRLVLAAYVEVAEHSGPSRTAEELLPQCWEQVNNRHSERRTLVAEVCCALAPCLPPDMVASLVLSILKQLAEDKEASVRQAALGQLSGLLALLPDHDKYSTVEQLLLGLALDSEQGVSNCALTELLPAVVAWLAPQPALLGKLLQSVLSALTDLLARCPVLGGLPVNTAPKSAAVHLPSEFLLRSVGKYQERQANTLLCVYTDLLPSLAAAALETKPAWATEGGGAAALRPGVEAASGSAAECNGRFGAGGEGHGAFASWATSEQHAEWELLEIMGSTALPAFIQALKLVAPQDDSSGLLRKFRTALVQTLAQLGSGLTESLAEPLFTAASTLPARAIWGDSASSPAPAPAPHIASLCAAVTPLSSGEAEVARLTVLPQHLAAVLPSLGGWPLRETLWPLMRGKDPWAAQHLQVMVSAWSFGALFPEVLQVLLEVLGEAAGERGPDALACAAGLAGALAPSLTYPQMKEQALPLLLRLCKEGSERPQEVAVEALGEVVLAAGAKGSLQAVHLELETLLSQTGESLELLVLRALCTRIPQAQPPHLEWLLQRVLHLLASVDARYRSGGSPTTPLRKAAAVAFHIARAVSLCEVRKQTVSLHLRAALQALLRVRDLLSPLRQHLLEALLRDAGTPCSSAAREGEEGGGDPRHSLSSPGDASVGRRSRKAAPEDYAEVDAFLPSPQSGSVNCSWAVFQNPLHSFVSRI